MHTFLGHNNENNELPACTCMYDSTPNLKLLISEYYLSGTLQIWNSSTKVTGQDYMAFHPNFAMLLL